jgi:hypothetical protein
MGVDTVQWRAAIGRFLQRLTQSHTGGQYDFISKDPRLLLFFYILLASFGSVHPHPGPNNKSFESAEERNLFNSIRGKESRAIRMESHVNFLRNCLVTKRIPKGLDFKFELCTAFDGQNIDLGEFLKKSKESLITLIIQHYENQLPRIREEVTDLYARLSEKCSHFRFYHLRQDLNFFAKKIRQNCKYTKMKKNQKLQRISLQSNTDSPPWIPELGLTMRERDVIIKKEWITDEIIDAASTLLKNQFPFLSHGLHQALFSEAGFVINPHETLQFHCVNRNHWVISSSFGGRIKIYDSLPSGGDKLSEDLLNQLQNLYSPDGASVTVERVPVQRQLGSSDCGLFAIGFATVLLDFEPVSNLVFDQSKMRLHLINCLENQRITPFPIKRNNESAGQAEIF